MRLRGDPFAAVNSESVELAWNAIGNCRPDGAGNPILTIATGRNGCVACPTLSAVSNSRDNDAAVTGAVTSDVRPDRRRGR